ncbi:serine proteinase stubble isoform X1 [Dendroctonus ponderosae]|nr:serine proteinase stubble isoform X1 [Dendroctonus ponderosae]
MFFVFQMLPATLVTLATFLLDLSSASPVYNMQPAFITTNIGSTNGRNIRNLPCVSRKNNGLTGVCMFAIDCLKSNGTHLGTCIDRFYFGSCCHIEPIKEAENSIETNIILDSRVPPERVHNTTLLISTSTQPSFSSGTAMAQNTTTTNAQTKLPSITTTKRYSSTMRPTTTKSSSKRPSLIIKPSTTKPIEPKLPLASSTIFTSTTEEATTTPQKLQTFQIIDGALLETTTIKHISVGTSKRPTTPLRTSTKSPVTTTKPRPAVTAPHRPYHRPSSTSATHKPSRHTTSKPPAKHTRPTKGSTTKRPVTSTTSKITSTRIPATTNPTRRHTRPTATTTTTTTAKPIRTTTPPVRTTTQSPSRHPTTVTTRKPSPPTTRSPISTTAKPSTSSLKPVSSTSTQTTHVASSSQASGISTSVPSIEDPVVKKNITQIMETELNPANNEVIESSGLLTLINGSSISTSTVQPATTSSAPVSSPITTSSAKPETSAPTATTSTTITTSTVPVTSPKPLIELTTWTETVKNETTINIVHENVTTSNFTGDWIPITTPDSWVPLPSLTPVTLSPIASQNASTVVLSSTTPVSLEPLSTITPVLTSSTHDVSASEFTESPLITMAINTTVSSVASTTFTVDVTENTTAITEAGGGGTSTETMETTLEMETSSSATTTEDITGTKPVNMSDFTDVCGRRMWPEARIVGGEKSTFGKWPWQISLRQWRTSTYLHKCGAALLNENWAITAAHCVDNVPPSDLLLRLGEHDLSNEAEPYLHEERRVQIVASHPQFDPRTFEYDLALLRFYEPVQFQPNIIPVCVPKTDENFVGRTAYVTGWGRLYEDGPLPSVLQEVSVPVINNSVCESMYRSAGYIEHIPHIFICAGWRKGGFDSCEGDSGGPMVIQREDKRFLLSGVISWGIGCAEPNQPGVYTRISEFKDWINQILQF